MGFGILNIYSAIQKRVNERLMFIITLLIILISLLVFSTLALNPANQHTLSFALYIWIGPPVALLNLVTTGLFLQSFDLRQGKRLYALLNTGEIIASILGYMFLPTILKAIGGDPWDLLWFADIGIVACLILVPMMLRAANIKPTSKARAAAKKKANNMSISQMLRDPYILFVSIVGMLSMLSVYFADFGLLGGTKLINEDGKAPVQFIAMFYALIKTFELAMSFFSGGLLNQFGMRIGLTILPYLMTGCMLIATLTGAFFEPAIFFVFLAFNRFLDRVVRKGLDNPSFRILFQPLKPEIRTQTQTFVDGIIKQLAIAIAGISLLIITHFFNKGTPQQNLVWFAAINFALLFTWAFFARRTYEAYRNKLRQNAATMEAGELSQSLTGMDALEHLRHADNPTISLITNRVYHYLYPEPDQNLADTDPDRVLPMLKENKRETRLAALHLAKKYHDPRYTPRLMELFQQPALGYAAADTIIQYGDMLISDIELIFNKTRSVTLQKRILTLYAQINSTTTQRLILEKLQYTNREIQMEAIHALIRIDFKYDDSARILIKDKIEKYSSTILWCEASLADLGQDPQFKMLIDALEAQQQEDTDTLFLLLTLLYGKQTIGLIRDSLNAGKEGNVYALELIDNFIDDDMKKPLMALLENSGTTTKLKKLAYVYPQQRYDTEDRLRDIINKDYVQVNIWIKLQALYLLGKTRHKWAKQEIAACIYHPHPLMQEAARLLSAIPPKDILIYDKLNLLRRNPAFEQIPSYKLVWVALLAVHRHFRAGETYLQSKHEESYMLIEGEMRYQTAQEDGTLPPGKLVISGIHTEAPIQSLTAVLDSRVLLFRKPDLIELILSDHELSENVWQEV